MYWDAFLIGIGGFLVAYALYAAVSSLWRVRGFRRLCGFVGGVLIAYGIAAFYGAAISAGGSLPATFEWPIGRADQMIQAPDGRRIAVHPASAHIQVYDPDWKFLRGWLAQASGGDFKARLLPDEKLEVWTARGAQHFIFTLDGAQLAELVSTRGLPASSCYRGAWRRSYASFVVALLSAIHCLGRSSSRWTLACLL